MKVLTTTIARLLFALPFALFGLFHYMHPKDLLPLVPVPGGLFWVYAVGLVLIAGAAGIATNQYGKWAALGIALLMLVFILTIHIPAMARGGPNAQLAMMMMLKDLGLGAGALAWAGIFHREEKGIAHAAMKEAHG